MDALVPIIAAGFALLSAVIGGYFTYSASTKTLGVTERAQTFEHFQGEIDRLRDDLREVDEQRRLHYNEAVASLRMLEAYRAWGYGLVRLLNENGIAPVPPEPLET